MLRRLPGLLLCFPFLLLSFEAAGNPPQASSGEAGLLAVEPDSEVSYAPAEPAAVEPGPEASVPEIAESADGSSVPELADACRAEAGTEPTQAEVGTCQEMQEVRQAERAAVDEETSRALELLLARERLCPGGPLHARLSDALDSDRDLPLAPSELEGSLATMEDAGGFDVERAQRLYDIPVDMHPLVAEYIRFFQNAGRKHYVRWLGRAQRYLPIIRQTLREAGLPQDTVFLAMIESGFSTSALSTAKAAGLWQFIEPTGRRFGLRVDFWVDERRDPVKATIAAANYLKELYAEFGDWRLAWAGYNAGAGKVRRAIRDDGSTRFWDMVEGRTLRRETKHYVPKLMAAALISKHLSAFGFSEEEIPEHGAMEYDEVEVPEATDIDVIARAAGVQPEEIRELNPQLRRWCTPPARAGESGYRIRLPAGTRERFAEEYAKIAPKDRLTFRTHTIARGDTLSQIARRYGTPAEVIAKANRIRDGRKLRVGETLVIPVPMSEGSPTRQARVVPTPPHSADRPAPRVVEAAAPERASARAGSAVVHTVVSGDSLWSIAREHDVHVEELLRWNGISRRSKLRVGQRLRIEKSAPEASSQGSKPGRAGSSRRAL